MDGVGRASMDGLSAFPIWPCSRSSLDLTAKHSHYYRWVGFREHTPSAKTQKRHPWQAQRRRLRTSSLRCARSRANALRCSKTLPAFLSGRRDALLQAYAPFASRLADASGTYLGASDGWQIQTSAVTFQKVPVNPIHRAFCLPAVVIITYPLAGLAI